MAELARRFAVSDAADDGAGPVPVRTLSGRQMLKLQVGPRADIDPLALGELFACAEFPDSPLAVARGTPTVFWTAPGEWLIAGGRIDAGAIRPRLHELLGGAAHALTDTAHGIVLLELGGGPGVTLLSMATAMAFSEAAPAPGHYVLTRMHAGAVLVHRPGDELRYELQVPRSYARFLYDWLVDLAARQPSGAGRR